MSTLSMSRPRTVTASRPHWPAVLCWLTVLLDGFDLVALGAVIPTLIGTGHLGFTPQTLTSVATASLVGVAIGAALVGPLADRVGRRIVLLASIALFSVFTLVVPLAGSIALFGAFRLLAGIGLGACMPTALALMSEHMPLEHRSHASTATMTGYHVGAVVASLLALWLLPDWHILFYVGGAAGLLLMPLLWARLPESEAFLAARHTPPTERTSVFRREFLRPNLGVWVGSFMGLLLVHGLNTWLPQLMRQAGYGVASSVTMLFVLNVGAVVGLLIAGRLADRHGVKPTILLWFAASAVLLALLSVRLQNTFALNAVIFVTGLFVFSAQALVYAYITHAFPAAIRGTSLGLASSIGRLGAIAGPLVTGHLVAAGLAYPWGFWFFAAVAVLGLLVLAAIPHERAMRGRHSG